MSHQRTAEPDGIDADTSSRGSVFLAVVRRSGPHIIEASLIPTALFYTSLVMWG